MGTKVIDPSVPSSVVKREIESLPALPRVEAQRLRRAVRGYADVALPQIMKRLVDIALNSEDEKLAADVGKWVAGIAIKGKSNEELDPPEAEEIDGQVVGKDPVTALEEATTNVGDGAGAK